MLLRATDSAAAAKRDPLFPIGWNHPIERKKLKINGLEHVLIRKVYQLFWNMLWRLRN